MEKKFLQNIGFAAIICACMVIVEQNPVQATNPDTATKAVDACRPQLSNEVAWRTCVRTALGCEPAKKLPNTRENLTIMINTCFNQYKNNGAIAFWKGCVQSIVGCEPK